jgi:hypothetical protein
MTSAMTSDAKPSPEETTRGWTGNPATGRVRTRSVVLPAVVAVGFLTWGMLFGRAVSQSGPAASSVTAAPNPSRVDPAITDATLASPAEQAAPAETTPAETSPLDGLKISSQSWRRGGLGSNALVTFTLRNRNDYAVRDIEISCAFSRRDGSHLTDRNRTIHDIVDMKSRKTFARLHIGFVNVNASKAKCALVAASRI